MSSVDVSEFVQDRTLVFTVTSDGYKYLTWNLWLNIQKLKLPLKLLILCLDQESHHFFRTIAMIPSVLYKMPGSKLIHKEPLTYGTHQFKRLTAMKVGILGDLVHCAEIDTLLFLDSDIVLFQDPVPYISMMLEQRPLWFQCDEKMTDDNQCSSDPCAAPCTGVIAFRLGPDTRDRFTELFRLEPGEEWNISESDQDYIQRRLIVQKIEYGTLPRPLFPNGTFIPNDLYKTAAAGGPYLLHFNFMLGSDKIKSMRKHGVWYVPV